MRTTRWALSPLFAAAGVLLLARSPAARQLVPALGLFTGALGPVLLAIAVAVSLVRWKGWPRLPVPSSAALFLTTALVAGSVGIHHVSRLGPTGDEVRYLLTAQSLWREGDLDLRDNFLRGDYREYVPQLRREPGIRGKEGTRVPLHRPGLALLAAPAYALGGRAACMVLLSLLLAGLGLVVRRLAREATGDEGAALLAWAAAVGPPAFYYAAFLYPEVPAALSVALAVAWARPGASVSQGLVAALAASCLPWLHPRLALAAAALGVIAVVRLSGRARIAFVTAATAMAAAHLAFNRIVYRDWVPLRAYHATLGRVPAEQAIAGLLLDPSFGLLVYAPIFLLALAGGFVLLRRRDPDRFAWLLLAFALLAPVATFRHWWGGYSPPARLVTALVPVLAVLVAVRFAEHGPKRRGLARGAATLVALGAALALFTFADPGRRLMVQGHGSEPRVWAALAGQVSLARYLPRMAKAADPEAATPEAPADEKRVAVVWGVALGLLLALDRLAARSDRADRAFGVLACSLALTLTLAVDHWARRERPSPAALPSGGAEEAEEASEDAGP